MLLSIEEAKGLSGGILTDGQFEVVGRWVTADGDLAYVLGCAFSGETGTNSVIYVFEDKPGVVYYEDLGSFLGAEPDGQYAWTIAAVGDSDAPPTPALPPLPDPLPLPVPEPMPASGQPVPAGWLYVDGPRIRLDGREWVGHGVNTHDTRGCWGDAFAPPDVGKAKAKIDRAKAWGSTFIRVCLENDPSVPENGGIHENEQYASDILELVTHATDAGLVVLLSLWVDPTFDDDGLPTNATIGIWRAMADMFATNQRVIFGLANEPQRNSDGARDEYVWGWMRLGVQAIRDVEAAHGAPPHLVAVQGTGDWARRLDYYIQNPIPDPQVVYEGHFYDPIEKYDLQVALPKITLPVIIGEYGPADGFMTDADVDEFQEVVRRDRIPSLGWTLHAKCPPNMLEDDGTPSWWGETMIDFLGGSDPGTTTQEPDPIIESPPELTPSPEGELPLLSTMPEGNVRVENFTWRGTPAAMIGGGAGATVWWPEQIWDVRGDMDFNSQSGSGHHIDIHKALKPTELCDAQLDNTDPTVGGDDSPGVGIMRLDFQGILSARLRNPLLISEDQPAVVDFWAPAYVTTGHWWEVVLTDAADIVGAEHSAVPGRSDDDGFQGPPGIGLAIGAGHSPPVDSINVIAMGALDVPCRDPGWRIRWGAISAKGGVRTSHYPGQAMADLPEWGPDKINELVHWRIEYVPNRVRMYADFEMVGLMQLIADMPVEVPFAEAHVHLVAVAYQANHHPATICNPDPVREIAWRQVAIGPLKYAWTGVYPDTLDPEIERWRNFDIRDTQRRGEVNGIPQPNAGKYDRHNTQLHRGGSHLLGFEMPTAAKGAALVYDIRGGGDLEVTLNGASIGNAPRADSVQHQDEGFKRRAITLPFDALRPDNTLILGLGGAVDIDRVEVEFYYS